MNSKDLSLFPDQASKEKPISSSRAASLDSLSSSDGSAVYSSSRSDDPFKTPAQKLSPCQTYENFFPPESSIAHELCPYLTSDGGQSTTEFLSNDLTCPVLDELYPHLHLVGRMSSSHIDPLHVHLLKGRSIVIAEDPGLHLIWHYKTLYIKPFPAYLFSLAFWAQHLTSLSTSPTTRRQRAAALGFIRSYGHLIQHPSDFHLALAHHLIPCAPEITYASFRRFVTQFGVRDQDVSPRYRFGQLRLSRLNWAVRFFRPESLRARHSFVGCLYYQERFWYTGQVLEEFGAPLVAGFAALTLVLSALQVGLAAYPPQGQEQGLQEMAFMAVSWGLALCVVLVLVLLAAMLISLYLVVGVLQLRFAKKEGKERRVERIDAEEA